MGAPCIINNQEVIKKSKLPSRQRFYSGPKIVDLIHPNGVKNLRRALTPRYLVPLCTQTVLHLIFQMADGRLQHSSRESLNRVVFGDGFRRLSYKQLSDRPVQQLGMPVTQHHTELGLQKGKCKFSFTRKCSSLTKVRSGIVTKVVPVDLQKQRNNK